jgi:hypothetical protein
MTLPGEAATWGQHDNGHMHPGRGARGPSLVLEHVCMQRKRIQAAEKETSQSNVRAHHHSLASIQVELQSKSQPEEGRR